jgi:hypothetical protein
LKLHVFSREAATADSCGRQPAEKNPRITHEPRSGDSNLRRGLLSPLRGFWILFWPLFRGLTPTAICYRRFAAPENVQLQNLRFGLRSRECPLQKTSKLTNHEQSGMLYSLSRRPTIRKGCRDVNVDSPDF